MSGTRLNARRATIAGKAAAAKWLARVEEVLGRHVLLGDQSFQRFLLSGFLYSPLGYIFILFSMTVFVQHCTSSITLETLFDKQVSLVGVNSIYYLAYVYHVYVM